MEDGQPPEDEPLMVGKQVVAPVQRGPQCLLAVGQVGAAPDEQGEAVVETPEELLAAL